jgi:hypothetical protein
MAGSESKKIVCPKCCAVLEAGDRFCRHCGQATGDAVVLVDGGPMASPSVRPPTPAASRTPWVENVWVVLLMLFVMLGPLALPMLWRSRKFSLAWKFILTIVVAGFTVIVFVVLWYVFNQLIAPLRDALQGL